ncbi:MAG TPA: type II toxin-antitoxin system VapC family toxin [Thermoanaerobaculia bacterium]
MILLDTNIVSALMKRETDLAVLEWLDGQPSESIWISSITVFEIRFGLEILATGKRRHALEETFEAMLQDDPEGRIIAFDELAAHEATRVAAEQRRRGRTLEIRDVQIAGVALARKAAIATRNLRHFEGLGIELIDPWST